MLHLLPGERKPQRPPGKRTAAARQRARRRRAGRAPQTRNPAQECARQDVDPARSAPDTDDFAVNLNKELGAMLRTVGPSQVHSIMGVLTEARLRDQVELPAREPLFEELFELRGEDHSACDIGLRNARFFYDLGWEKRCKGDIQGAVDLLKVSARLEASDPKTWINLGYLQAQIGDNQAARLALQTAARLAPRLPVVHFNLGVVSLAAGHCQAAVDALDAAIALDPSRPEFYRARALAHRRRSIDMGTGESLRGDFYSASNDYVTILATPRRPAPHHHRLQLPADQAQDANGVTVESDSSQGRDASDTAPEAVLDQAETDGSRTRIVSFPSLHPLFFEASQFWDQVEFSEKVTFGKYIDIAEKDPHERSEDEVRTLANVIRGVHFWRSLPKLIHAEVARHARSFRVDAGQPAPSAAYCILLKGKLDLFKQHPAVAVPAVIKTCWPGEMAQVSETPGPGGMQDRSAVWRAADPSCGLYLPAPHVERILTNYAQAKIQDNLALLREFRIFAGLSMETLHALTLAMGPERLFTADQKIVAEGAPARHLGFVLHGKCEVTRGKTVVAEIGTKDIFNGTLLVARSDGRSARRNTVSIACKTRSTVLLLAVEDLFRLTTFEQRQHLRKNFARIAPTKAPKSYWKVAHAKLAPVLAVKT